MSSGNWENNPAGDWFRKLWDACKSNRFRLSPPDLIITKATIAPDCKVSMGIANSSELSGEPETIHLTLNATEVTSVRSSVEQYAIDRARMEAERREREIREELFAGETPNGNIMDYEVIFVPGRHGTTCVHRASIADMIVGVYSRNNISEVNITTHAVQLRPLLRFGDVGFCHERKAIYVSSERRYRACDVLVEDRELLEEFDPRRQRLPDIMVMARCSVHDLGINLRVGWLEGTRGVSYAKSQARKRLQKACGEQRRWPTFEQEYPAVVSEPFYGPGFPEIDEHYRRMIDRLSRQEMPRFYGADRSDREPLPQTSKPPESASTCSSCKTENLESFLRAGGKVYCHACFEQFPPCCFCGNKVPWEASYTSKRDDKRLACPPCIEDRKGQKLVKEVAG